MLCALSGEAPQVPVVSTKNGLVFEKRLIEAFISKHGKDPITGEETSIEDLMELKTAHVTPPRPPTLTSIPALLSTFQNEWDSLALETFSLKQQLVQTRQELGVALYRQDAAVRVIARLKKERDEAREIAARLSSDTRRATAGAEQMDVDMEESNGLPPEFADRVTETQQSLSKNRRKRHIPEEWVTTDMLSSFSVLGASDQVHSNKLAASASGDLISVYGGEGFAAIYSVPEKRLIQVQLGQGVGTGSVWAGERVAISTSSGEVKLFVKDGTEVASCTAHAGEATDLALHASGDILASVGVDKSYVLYEVNTLKILSRTYTDSALSCVQFHPDGHILAAGAANNDIKIFDVKTGEVAAVFKLPAPVKLLQFSENGVWLASVVEDSTTISIWDLRSTSETKVLDVGGRIDSLDWDYSAQYLLVGGPNGLSVQRYYKPEKAWSEPLRVAEPAVSIAWGKAARNIHALNKDGKILTIGTSS